MSELTPSYKTKVVLTGDEWADSWETVDVGAAAAAAAGVWMCVVYNFP